MTSSSQRLALLEAVVEQSFNAVLITDANLANGGPFIVYVNPAFCSMTGYTAEALIGASPRILQGPDTDPQVIERMRECLSESLFFEGSTVNYRADGSPYIVEWKISPVRDDAGTVCNFVSVQQNISPRIRAEREQHLLAQALNAALDPIIITDCNSTIVFANEAFQQITGYSSSEILGENPRMLSSGKHDEAFYAQFKEALKSGAPLRTTFINKRKDGSLFYAEHSISPLCNLEGAITHYVSISQDVTTRLGREQKLLEIAHSDPLTGLDNRRSAEHTLERQIPAVSMSGKPFSLIICDIDHFKAVNDRYGHPAGDSVITSVAAILKQRIRLLDVAARWGGEEFLILVPDSSLKQAAELAERIRKSVESLVIPETGSVTISLGVAELSAGESAASLIQRADKALYQAKRLGRNRVECA
ncbi:sensor domain-containing diguanylate cyclase [Pseudomonas syringae]|uniref:sensor domain-containing diguanylate cyclase n=1 Tax=Pseudomonas syringae TaxID=317 RepID=UPI00028D79FC|nr:sensor domain-containing diguanylate cyclase [Pseudomonas syringae]EKG40126.1 sensor y box/GGDEF domain-containing protein domain-containing protein [Pseudomonas syringae pv. avellanae str. ISPaVe037]MCF9000709.1 diguanylate cyclase [Pseudomonas syringae]MCL6309758.1 diguanylate cyclase [Pseudomonas syringae]MDF7794950.1 diguanylate cyclase [Pseudomonas syringae]PIO95011.1 GGDEF domain-containing protein [Pseudomonas syringae]